MPPASSHQNVGRGGFYIPVAIHTSWPLGIQSTALLKHEVKRHKTLAGLITSIVFPFVQYLCFASRHHLFDYARELAKEVT